jgi:hypothetical protein
MENTKHYSVLPFTKKSNNINVLCACICVCVLCVRSFKLLGKLSNIRHIPYEISKTNTVNLNSLQLRMAAVYARRREAGMTPLFRTYLIIPWSRVLLERLTGLQLVKKFPAFYGTRRLIIAFISACHLSLSLASSIQSIPPHPNH